MFKKISRQNYPTAVFLLVIGVIILVGSSWLWWTKVFNDPERVFNQMLNNNLRTTSITRESAQESENGLIKQQVQLSFAAKTGIHAQTTIKQNSSLGENSVVTETYSTPFKDYVRYTHISTPQKSQNGQPPDFSPVLGVWTHGDNTQNSQFFSEAVLNAAVFGNFPQNTRQNLLNQMKKVYQTNFNDVKRVSANGRREYIFAVSVKPNDFLAFFKNYAKALNLTNFDQLDDTALQNSEPLKLTMTVDILSRQLVKVEYQNTRLVENYSGHGLSSPIIEPQHRFR